MSKESGNSLEEYLKLMERFDHGAALAKYAALGAIAYKVFKLAMQFKEYIESFHERLNIIQQGQQKAADDRHHIKNLLTDQGLRLQYLEQKYAGVRVGETLVPENTPAKQEERKRVGHITGSFPPATKPPKKGSS